MMISSKTLNAQQTKLQTVCASPMLLDRYLSIRNWTTALCQGLSAEDVTPQSMPDASPVKWHLAHTTWFFETFVLEKACTGYQVICPEYKVLFNSYYNSVGQQYARPHRGLITRPSLQDVLHYRDYVDQFMLTLLEKEDQLDAALQLVIEIGLQHEQQHQELILTDLKHLFSHNSLYPIYTSAPEVVQPDQVLPLNWHGCEEGLYIVGHKNAGFSFDNENPKHPVYLQSFELASRLVSNREYLEFMDDNAYHRAELWLSDAWQLLKQEQWSAPLYWQKHENEWHSFTLSGLKKIQLDEPVTHVSFYEADAYARWAGARLPTEFEWEVMSDGTAVQGHFAEDKIFHPKPALMSQSPIQQLYGDTWEWTASPYIAYPAYRPLSGELAEYNGKFMCNQMVLRGGSCVTPRSHIRASYRNFFSPAARWQFSGIRLARDLK